MFSSCIPVADEEIYDDVPPEFSHSSSGASKSKDAQAKAPEVDGKAVPTVSSKKHAAWRTASGGYSKATPFEFAEEKTTFTITQSSIADQCLDFAQKNA